jgi:hypothetical protein
LGRRNDSRDAEGGDEKTDVSALSRIVKGDDKRESTLRELEGFPYIRLFIDLLYRKTDGYPIAVASHLLGNRIHPAHGHKFARRELTMVPCERVFRITESDDVVGQQPNKRKNLIQGLLEEIQQTFGAPSPILSHPLKLASHRSHPILISLQPRILRDRRALRGSFRESLRVCGGSRTICSFASVLVRKPYLVRMSFFRISNFIPLAFVHSDARSAWGLMWII